MQLFLFLSQHTLTQNRKRCQTSLAKSLPLFPSLVFLVLPSFGCHQTFCSAFLFFPSVFPIFFFRQKPDVFDPENHGTVDDLHNTQKESNQQKHHTCLFTDACCHFSFLALPKQQHTSCIDRHYAVKPVPHNTWSYSHADKEQSHT